MKKVLIMVFMLVLVMIVTPPAMAAGGEAVAGEAEREFFTWDTLATYAGAVLATSLIVQLLKDVGFIKKIPTRVFAYIIALILLLAANYFLGGFTLEAAALCIINAAVVALAANGAFDALNDNRKNEQTESE